MKKNNIISIGLIILSIGIFLLLIYPSFVSTSFLDIFGPNSLLTSQSQTSNNQNKKNSEGIEEVFVKRVVDGDTIVLNDGRTIRYLYVDTPETVKPGAPVKCYGKEASNFNKQEVENKTIWLKSDKDDQDRYGRDLRIIFLKPEDTSDISKSLNAKMVQSGYARASIYKPNVTYKDQFLEWQQEAKEQKIGVWKCNPDAFS